MENLIQQINFTLVNKVGQIYDLKKQGRVSKINKLNRKAETDTETEIKAVEISCFNQKTNPYKHLSLPVDFGKMHIFISNPHPQVWSFTYQNKFKHASSLLS